MTRKNVIRCVICGIRATKTVAHNKASPVCDNPVCFHTRIDAMNKSIIEQLNGGLNVAHS